MTHVSLAQWSTRRLAAIWVAGIALQLALVIVPTVLVMRLVRRDGPRIQRESRQREAYLKGAERADSVSRAQQVALARESGNVKYTADGQPVFAIVGMPSGRPDSQTVAAFRLRTEREAWVFVAIQFGAVPLALLYLTLAWTLARRRNNPPALGRLLS
ncbi:MAG: hypothetical protein ABI625_20970 [bacterium]